MFHKINLQKTIYLCLCAIACSHQAVWAESNKIMTKLSSQSAVCKQQNNKNVCTYSGRAKFRSDSAQLEAEKITIYQAGNKINKIIALGENPHYSETKRQKNIDARADIITIYLEKKLMVLQGNSKVDDGKIKCASPYIEYNLK